MRKIAVLILFLAGLVAAVTFTGVDNGDGTITITYDEPIIGLALNFRSNTVTVTHVTLPPFFDIFMDYAYEQGESYVYGQGTPIAQINTAGIATLPSIEFCISAGGLKDNETDIVPTSGEIILAVTGTGNIEISANDLRGGVVDYNGAMTTNLPIFLNGPPLPCLGDINGDGAINSSDIGSLVNKLVNEGEELLFPGSGLFVITSSNQYYTKEADVNGDNAISSGDIGSLINKLVNEGEELIFPGSGIFEITCN